MVRLGMIGTGRIAKRAVKEISEVQGISLISVFNPHKEHADQFALENGIQNFFSEMESFLESIDAVYIASPHGTHYEYAKDSLEQGKHVICEKPMTLDDSQATELFEIAERNKLILMDAVKTAYCPGFKKLCEVVNSGVIGDIVDVEAAFTRLTVGKTREFADIINGGAFTEFGTYTMLPVFRFLGTEYSAVSFNSIPAGEGDSVDGYTKVFFDFGDRLATAKCGLTVKSEGQLIVAGTKGYILVPSPWWLTKYFEVRFEDPHKIDRYECDFKGDGLRYEFEEFIHRINGITTEKVENTEAITRSKVFKTFLSGRNKTN